jgi:hypothetical protein
MTADSMATGQVVITAVATVIVPARATREKVTIKNIGGPMVYVGPAPVTVANGYGLAPMESSELTSKGAIQGIAVSDAAVIAGLSSVEFVETYS